MSSNDNTKKALESLMSPAANTAPTKLASNKKEKTVRRTYEMPVSYHTRLTKYIAANMIDYYNETGKTLTETAAILRILDSVLEK